MLLYGVKPKSKAVVALVVITFAAVAYFLHYMLQAPWGKLDANVELGRQLQEIVAKAPTMPRIVLGKRATAHVDMASTWSGYSDFDAIVAGQEGQVRLTWQEIKGENLITKVEVLMFNSPPVVVWARPKLGFQQIRPHSRSDVFV
jgi:hypothetical protein